MVLRELRLFIVIEHINNKSVFKGGGFFFAMNFGLFLPCARRCFDLFHWS